MKNNIQNKLIFACIFSLIFSSCGKKTENTNSKNQNNDENLSEVFNKNVEILDLNNYQVQYEKNKTIIINNEKEENSEKHKIIMEKLGGISFQGNLIILKKMKEGPKYIVFQETPTKKELNKYLEKLNKKSYKTNSTLVRNDTGISETFEISSATVSLVKKNISCPMKLYSNDDETKDYCDRNASLELNYKIDMSGSKATMKEDPKTGLMIKTDNAKYILMTVSPEEEGGTGWHIAKEINQGFNRWNVFLTKRDFVGPYANKYNFWIKNTTNNREVHLVETFPQNTNPGASITKTNGMTVGISGGLNAGTSNAHPYAVVNLGASIQVSDSRNVSYVTQEYTVENASYNNIASWIWDSKVNDKICDYISRKSFNSCHYTEAIWKKSWTANKNKFSAISHKSFTPTFQAIYKTNKNNVGKSNFEMGTNAETGVILGKKTSLGFMSYVSIQTDNYKTPDITQNFAVDWSSPYFAAEQNIRLQNMSETQNTKCIFAQKNKIVTESECDESRGQIWGYDNEEKQFKTRIENDFCLSVNQDNFIEVNLCNMNNNQKWILNSDGYIQLNSISNKVIGINSDKRYILVDKNSNNAIKFEAYKAFL